MRHARRWNWLVYTLERIFHNREPLVMVGAELSRFPRSAPAKKVAACLADGSDFMNRTHYTLALLQPITDQLVSCNLTCMHAAAPFCSCRARRVTIAVLPVLIAGQEVYFECIYLSNLWTLCITGGPAVRRCYCAHCVRVVFRHSRATPGSRRWYTLDGAPPRWTQVAPSPGVAKAR